MKEEEIREGDIVEIDYIAEFTKEHINEGKALVIWNGFNNQPLVRKLSTKKTIWTCYEHIARVVGHIDLEGYMDKALNMSEIEPQESKEQGITLEEAIKRVQAMITYMETLDADEEEQKDIEAYRMSVKALKHEPIFDKIKSEVMDKSYLSYDDNPRHIIDESWVLEIIDKYAAKSEEQEMKNAKKNTKKKEGIEL